MPKITGIAASREGDSAPAPVLDTQEYLDDCCWEVLDNTEPFWAFWALVGQLACKAIDTTHSARCRCRYAAEAFSAGI